MKIHLIAGLVLAASAFSIVRAGDVPTATVKYGDLNLSGPEGAAVLYQRLAHAAQSVCETLNPASHSVKLAPAYQACLQKAISDAVVAVNRPLVSQYAATKAAGSSMRLAAR